MDELLNVNRRTLLGLAGSGHQTRTCVAPARIRDLMPVHAQAKFLGSVSGGDEQTVSTWWQIPGVSERAQIYVSRRRLFSLLSGSPGGVVEDEDSEV